MWTFGPDLMLVALGGEVVVDYALRLTREFHGRRVWVAGYSNDVFGYVPSVRVLREGGYDGGDAMIYHGRPHRLRRKWKIESCRRYTGWQYARPADVVWRALQIRARRRRHSTSGIIRRFA